MGHIAGASWTCRVVLSPVSSWMFFLQPDMWKKCLECIDELLDILFENSNIFIGENIAEDSENLAISESQVAIRTVCLLTWSIM